MAKKKVVKKRLTKKQKIQKTRKKTLKAKKTKGYGKVVYRKKIQHGKTKVKVDKKRTALPPGKRKAKSGKTYYEYRRNRSDINIKKKL